MVKLKPGVNFDTNSCICNETTKDGSFMIKCTQKSCLCPWWHTCWFKRSNFYNHEEMYMDLS